MGFGSPEFTPRKVKRRGRQDGRDWRWKIWPPLWPFRESKSVVPRDDQAEEPFYESAIRNGVQQDVNRVGERWQELDRKLKVAFCRALAELDGARRAVAKEAPEAEGARRVLETARGEFLALEPPRLSPRWARFWLVVLAGGEVIVNATIFLLLGGTRLETYLASLGIGVTFPLLAHFLGAALRHADKTPTDKMLIFLSPLAALGLLAAISLLRAEFFEASRVASVLGLQLSGPVMAVLFVLLNIGIFFAATVLSYESSHTNPALYRQRWRNYQLAAKRFREEQGEAEESVARYERASRRYHEARQTRQKVFERYRTEAETLIEAAHYYVQLYRDANIRVRPGATRPECFNRDPRPIRLPAALKGLEWDCTQDIAAVPIATAAPRASEDAQRL